MTALITLPRRPPTPLPATAGSPSPTARTVHRSRREGVVIFAVFAAGYLAVAVEMVRHNILFSDALSRVGNGFYVLYSRDPHLPAVGFVWNPLPSLVLLPLFPLKGLFPVLVHKGFAGNISSSLFMAGAVVLMASCLRKLGVGRGWRLVLTALFGVQPMIVLYAGSGLSEPMLLFSMLLTTSALISWARERRPGQLVSAGLALAMAYMTRYEAVGPAVAVVLFVAVVSLATTGGDRTFRAQVAMNDVALVGGPFGFAFGLWALMARILVGEWLPTFSSQYGNSAQVSSGRVSIQSVTGSTIARTANYEARQITGLAPFIIPLILLALLVAVARRDLASAVAPLVLGAVLAFDDGVLLAGRSFGWLRFQIAVVPLGILLAGTVLAAIPAYRRRGTHRPARAQRQRRLWCGLVACAVSGMIAAGLPVEFHTLTTTRGSLAREEAPMLRSTFYPELASTQERRSLLIFDTERAIAAYLDAKRLPEGSVLADTAYAYPVVLASSSPRQFVITSDLDFKGAVSDPAGHQVSYLLVPAPNLGPADALRRRWPGLYENGSHGEGVLVKQWNGAFFGDWRLYRVAEH